VPSAYDRLPLNALRVFEAVATRLNFGEAAEALHVTPAAVSQQVKTLEEYLQTPLFRRSGRGVQLTTEGKRLLPGVRRALDELTSAMQNLKRDRESGVVKVSTVSSFLQKWLAPRLGKLRAQHPNIDPVIHTSRETIDFARTDFHAAIRLGGGNYEGLHVERVLDDWLVPVASPQVIKKHGSLPDEGDLSDLPLLHSDALSWAEWAADRSAAHLTPRGAFFDDSAGLLSAAVEGLGFAIVRWSIAAADVAAGRLYLANDRVLPYTGAHWFVCPKEYLALPKLVAFRDWLLAEARAFPLPSPIRRSMEPRLARVMTVK
jgi:LysR family glycine cleavage system transcriptional activator